MPKPQNRKRYVTPIAYAVGTDMPQAQYDEVLLKLVDWFAESRQTKEPLAAARQALKECLDGVTADGKPWFAASNASLLSRIRMKCRFDIGAMEPIRKGQEKWKLRKEKEKERQQRKRAKAQEDDLIPDELRDGLKKSAKYGDDPHVFLSSAEERRWRELKTEYVRQFPELDTVNASAELAILLDLHILAERQRMNVLQGKKVDPEQRAALAKELQEVKKALGIHPDQLAKRAKDKEGLTIGAAVARLEQMPDWRRLRQRFWAEELLQFFKMYMTPKADGQGYHLDEVGLFGLTKCYTCACAKCGQRNMRGLLVEEVETWLVKEGHLTPLALPEGEPVAVRSDDPVPEPPPEALADA